MIQVRLSSGSYLWPNLLARGSSFSRVWGEASGCVARFGAQGHRVPCLVGFRSTFPRSAGFPARSLHGCFSRGGPGQWTNPFRACNSPGTRGRNLHRTEIWVPAAFILQDCLRWLTHSSAKRALRHGCIIILSRHGDQKTAHLSLWEILMCCMCCTALAEPRSSFCGSGPRGPECDSQHIEVLHTQTHTSYIP